MILLCLIVVGKSKSKLTKNWPKMGRLTLEILIYVILQCQKLAFSSDVRASDTICCSRASLELHMCIRPSKYNLSSSLVVSSWMLHMYFSHFWSFFLLKDLKCPLLLLSNTLSVCTHAAVLKRIQPFHIWKWSAVLPEYRHAVRRMGASGVVAAHFCF